MAQASSIMNNWRPGMCGCGALNHRYPLYDAAGIFCAYVCEECEEKKRSEFNPQIFQSGAYAASGDEDLIGYEADMAGEIDPLMIGGDDPSEEELERGTYAAPEPQEPLTTVRIWWVDLDDEYGTEPQLFGTEEALHERLREIFEDYTKRIGPELVLPEDFDTLCEVGSNLVGSHDDCIRWGFEDVELPK
jgi:hypothetical protein